MSTPDFSLSLDEFPGLLDGPIQSDNFLGEKVVNALRESLEPYSNPRDANTSHLKYLLNKLRHSFWEVGDERNSMACADLTLALDPWDKYVLNILSDWYLETEPENAVRSLLSKAARFRDLPSLFANCLKRASEMCEQNGLHDVAQQLFFIWQELSTPTYSELNWLSFPVRNSGSGFELLPSSPFHPITTPAEVVNNASNGWHKGRWNPLTSKQKTLLRRLLKQHNLQPWTDTIVELSQNCIRFERAAYKSHSVGTSHLGGLPDVPEGWVWPDKLEFLAQFDLQEIAAYDVNHALPSHGLLRFFAGSDIWGEGHLCRVEWDQSDKSQLRRATCPADYGIMGLDARNDLHTVYQLEPVVPCRVISLPDSTFLYNFFQREEALQTNPNIFENIYRVQDKLLSHVHCWNHQLLGRDEELQQEAYRYRGDASQEDFETIRLKSKEWTLLAQIDLTGATGSTLYFLIRRDDLADRRFDRVYITTTSD